MQNRSYEEGNIGIYKFDHTKDQYVRHYMCCIFSFVSNIHNTILMLILIPMWLHKRAHKHLMYSDKYRSVRKITLKLIELANLKHYLK